jgi:hypothetical protein
MTVVVNAMDSVRFFARPFRAACREANWRWRPEWRGRAEELRDVLLLNSVISVVR